MEKEIIIGTTISILILLKFSERNFYLYSILSLPSTILHESTHLIMSIIFNGKPIDFNVIPKKKISGVHVYYELGYVTSVNIRWYNGFIIGMSPLILYIIAYYIFFSDISLFYQIFLIPILLHGGIPSTVDVKLAFESIYFILICVIIYIYLFFEHKESIIIINRSFNEIFITINSIYIYISGVGI